MSAVDCCGFAEASAGLGSVLFIMGRYAEAKEASAREGDVSCRSFENKRRTSPEAVWNKVFTSGYERSQKITSGLHYIGLQNIVATQV